MDRKEKKFEVLAPAQTPIKMGQGRKYYLESLNEIVLFSSFGYGEYNIITGIDLSSKDKIIPTYVVAYFKESGQGYTLAGKTVSTNKLKIALQTEDLNVGDWFYGFNVEIGVFTFEQVLDIDYENDLVIAKGGEYPRTQIIKHNGVGIDAKVLEKTLTLMI